MNFRVAEKADRLQLALVLQRVKGLANRARSSAVVWSWAFKGLRLASGLLLLPLLLTHLEKTEFAMYYVFLSVAGIVPFLDMGLSWSVGRFVSYAVVGATSLEAQGLPDSASITGKPNTRLLWQLLWGISAIYKYITIIGFFVLGTWGTLLVAAKGGETPNPTLTWVAWGLTLFAGMVELYTALWSVFLFGLNRVQENARLLFMGYFVRLFLSCVLLAAGAGLLSVPIGAIFGTWLTRRLIRRRVLDFLGEAGPDMREIPSRELLRKLWPNSWRLALQTISYYLRTQATVPLCMGLFGLSVTADFGLSLQVFGIATGMGMVWTNVKWPTVAHLRSAHDLKGIQRVTWPRLWLQLLTVVILAALAATIGPTLLESVRTDKRLLPVPLLILMGLTSLLDSHFVFWGSLLAVENRIPTLWSTVATNVAAILISGLLGYFTSMGVWALVVAPLLCGMLFIYWHWPRAGARSLGTTWVKFMFSRPAPAAPLENR